MFTALTLISSSSAISCSVIVALLWIVILCLLTFFRLLLFCTTFSAPTQPLVGCGTSITTQLDFRPDFALASDQCVRCLCRSTTKTDGM